MYNLFHKEKIFVFNFLLCVNDLIDFSDVSFNFSFVKENSINLESRKFYFLSDDEFVQLNKYEFPQKRYNFLLGRYAIKSLIKQTKNNCKIRDITIQNKIIGKPFVKDNDIGISISHSGECATAITFPSILEIAIDLEFIKNVKDDIGDLLSNNERSLIKNLLQKFSNQERNTIFWAAKESLSKFLGTGLNIIYETLEIESMEQTHTNMITIFYKNIKSAQTEIFIFSDLVIAITIPYRTKLVNQQSFLNLFNLYLEYV